jgi:PadR family transcriptional regulator PadR
MKTFEADLIRSSTQTVVLAALVDGPKYGYQILQVLRAESKGAMGLAAGTLYPVLHRLEVEAAVSSAWKDGTTRRRKYYSLTPKGKRLLRDKAQQWRHFSAVIDRMLKPALASL